jgi:hypothetical protein
MVVGRVALLRGRRGWGGCTFVCEKGDKIGDQWMIGGGKVG